MNKFGWFLATYEYWHVARPARLFSTSQLGPQLLASQSNHKRRIQGGPNSSKGQGGVNSGDGPSIRKRHSIGSKNLTLLELRARARAARVVARQRNSGQGGRGGAAPMNSEQSTSLFRRSMAALRKYRAGRGGFVITMRNKLKARMNVPIQEGVARVFTPAFQARMAEMKIAPEVQARWQRVLGLLLPLGGSSQGNSVRLYT